MVHAFLSLFAFLARGNLPQEAPELAAFESLFDGTTLEGWSGDPRFWRAEEGAIVGESSAANPCERTTYLVYGGGDFADFELRLEFRIETGNSGIQLRSRRVGRFDVAGYQADLEAGTATLGTFYEQYGRGVLAALGTRVVLAPEGVSSAQRFADEAECLRNVRAGDWNEMRVLARGNELALEINGRPTASVVDEAPAQARSSGLLALQLHAGPPMKVAFRNLRIRDLGGRRDERSSSLPQWIWIDESPSDHEEAWFRKDFTLAGEIGSAILFGSADDRMEVYLNGRLAAVADDWRYFFDLNVREFLVSGSNSILVWVQNDADAAGLCLDLRLADASGARSNLSTNDTWWARGSEARDWRESASAETGWKRALSFGPLGTPPWGKPLRSPLGTPEPSLSAGDLRLPSGFRAELLYSVPRARHGSWISLARDDRGRLFASDEAGYLFRVTPPPLGTSAGTRVERIDLDLGEAQGLLYAFDALYVVVNGRTGRWRTGLYRVRDLDHDDRFDSVELLEPLDGSGEHAPHAVVLGPDGASLYLIGGNQGDVPSVCQRLRARPVYEADSLLPQEPDPNGHPPGASVSGGWLARTDPDGRTWELVAVGLRNAYDLVFDSCGEAFTFDSDLEWDYGLPWYRPTRVLHLVSGADYGWRHGSGKWPEYWPDTLPAILDVGPGSPTGMVHAGELAFPPEYARSLLVGDWAFGRIQRIDLEPSGASFRARVEPFLEGRPLPVCDLVAGQDGALYFVTGGRGLQSGLYRVAFAGEAPAVRPAEEEDPAFARARSERRDLEAFHGVRDPRAIERAWSALASPDPFLRHAARTAIESQDVELWSERALAEPDRRAALAAWLALARSRRAEFGPPLLERILALFARGLEEGEELEALRVLDRILTGLGPFDDDSLARTRSRLEARFPSGRERIDRELASLLVYTRSTLLAPRALAKIAAATTDEEALAYAFLLRLVQVGWTPEARRTYFAWLKEAAETMRGGESLRNYVLVARDEALGGLGADEHAALGELGLPLPRSRLYRGTSAPLVREWTLPELLPHLGGLEHGRDPARGKALFERASCLQCHRMGGEGGSGGPDLSTAGARFSARDLLEAILRPSKTVSDPYQDTEVWTKDDRLFVGTVLAEDADRLTLRTRPPEESLLVIEKREIDLRRPTPVSRMPEGLFDTLELEEILDLVAFVLAGVP